MIALLALLAVVVAVGLVVYYAFEGEQTEGQR